MKPALWLYRQLVQLLPRSVRDRDGDEMLHTFADQMHNAPRGLAVSWRAFSRMPAVLVLEWRDEFVRARHRTLHGVSSSPPHQKKQMDAIVRALRYGTRSLLRTPAFSASVILLLGLGIGSVSGIFAVVDHVMVRSMPYPAADRLFVVTEGSHSMYTVRELQTIQSAEAWAAGSSDEANLTGEGEPQRIRNAVVTDGFFPMFGARASLGRLFQASDFSNPETAVLSHGIWVRVFGGDSSVVGRTIHIDDRALTVVGVMDGGFAVPEALVDAMVDVWRPVDPAADYMTNRQYHTFSVAGRLKPGTSLAQAQIEATRIAEARAKAYPDAYADGANAAPLPVVGLREATSRDVGEGLTILFAAVIVLLLVACANVTHLFLARGVTRLRELTVRRALGASTRSLLGQLMTESLLLGILGALVGVLFAMGGVQAFLALLPEGLPRADSIAVDARVWLFATAIGMLTAVIFGLLPALRFTRGPLSDPMRASNRGATSGRAAQTLRNGIVVLEVALSLVLVAQSGWLLRSFIRMSNQELGFRTQGVVTIPMSVPGVKDGAEWYRRMDGIRESLARIPGVKDVAFGITMPLEWVGGNRCCWGQRPTFTGHEPLKESVAYHPVSSEYFRLLNIPVLAGTTWSAATATASPAPVVINEVLARKVFGNVTAALGATLANGKTQLQVVGVVGNSHHYGADQNMIGSLYMPANAIPFSPGRVAIAVQTDRTDASLHADLRAAVWNVEKNLPVPVIRSLAEWSRADAAKRRFDSLFFATFSGIALLLVALGLAGTLLYMVSLQRRMLGIRLALGATPGALERGVMSRGIGLAAIGAVVGTAGAWASGRFIESRLYGVEARDFGTLAAAVCVLMLIAVVSSWVPARRAAGTSPMECMRVE
jgi:putative ABC transport system permease protein